jgi:hypothetical protein
MHESGVHPTIAGVLLGLVTRSSTTASVSRNARSDTGRCEPATASTARAKAMSVAAGIAHPSARPSEATTFTTR